MKKNSPKILAFLGILGSLGIFGVNTTFANTNTCAIQSGPIPEMTTYAKTINTELSEILTKSPKQQCNIKQSAYEIFEAARASIPAMEHTFTDFRYNFNSVTNGGKNKFVQRDEKFFDNIEKRISQTVEQMANSCQLNDENREQLYAMIVEAQSLRNAYRRAAIGSPITNPKGIRNSNIGVAEKISQAYSPNATVACIPNSPEQTSFLEKLKSSINIGASMDKSLESWRKALDMIRGGGNSMSASEVAARQRSLLQAELSRQGLSHNAKSVILKNFDCYKARTTGVNSTENVLEARAACLQMPITGIEKVFNIGDNTKSIYNNVGETWNNFVWSANTTDEFTTRRDIAVSRQNRSIDIETMHSQLNLLSSTDSDTNDNTQKGLIDLHINLMATNNLLEQRLPAMQSNCSKGQPDIIAGCR